MAGPEAILHLQVANYIKWQHRNLIFVSDFAAGLFLPPWLAKRQAELRSSRSYPDIFIAKPVDPYHGLFLELKKEGTVIFKKDGSVRASKKDWYLEQVEMHKKLNELGYLAVFAIGYKNTVKIIEDYLKGGSPNEDRPTSDSAF